MNAKEKYLNELERRISDLEEQLKRTQNKLTGTINGNVHDILNFGIAREAEQLTVIYGKLEELYSMKEAFNFFYDKEEQAAAK